MLRSPQASSAAAEAPRIEHHRAIQGGLAHFDGLPHIVLDGDAAYVTSYVQIICPDAPGELRCDRP
ncbi:MAG: hypothetical protein O7B98_05445 [Alphaproteobacteria bacterium]|nr:hypothetical protein [Alphaproteobacteria bacterium]MCZ6590571.1 hypothetical protein [Alphaproteobacteria bacterium]